jgi:diacylglycerol O-acyltransferase / wax synthase
MGTRIAPEDLTWLLMDEPNNLMHVNGLMGFDELPDVDALVELVMDRMVRKYRVLSQVAVQRDGAWMWEDDIDFAIERHVRRVNLDDAGSDGVREYVSAQLSVPFDRTRPLWEIQIITGPDGDRAGGYIYNRFHHGIGDGIRLVQMLLALCDPVEGAVPEPVGRNATGEHQHPLERVLHFVEHSVSDTLDYATHAGQEVASAGRTLMSTTNPLGLSDRLVDAYDLVRHPHKLVDALTGIASVDNTVSNSWREIGRMLLSDGHDAEAWSGHAGIDKSVAWIEAVPLAGLRAAARAHGVTLNDVLLAAVSLALTDYLAERGIDEITDLSWMMPVSLEPIDAALPDRLGNHFVVVMLSMPLGISEPGELIHEIHRRTTRLKHSAEPMVAFGFQRAVAESPAAVARRITKFFTGKTIGQLTNVPGPRVAMTLAGAPVRSILGWVPTSGDQPLGVSLFSYDDTLSVGVATDRRMIPDPLHFVELVERHLAELAQTAQTAHEGVR